MRPMAFAGRPRNVDRRSIHCSSNCWRCTSTSVLTLRWAISQAAMTVLPKAVVADRTPVSCASNALAAASCSGRKCAAEGHVQRAAAEAFIAQDWPDAQALEQPLSPPPSSLAASRYAEDGPQRSQ